jgi:hypothetical protein
MTKISYIHGIPQDEWSDRGGEVPAQSFLNYSGLTSGEMKLALLQEQLAMLAAFYPENKEFQQGKSMLENALYRGIHGAPPAFGILSPGLQAVAKAINKASRDNRPANGSNITARGINRQPSAKKPSPLITVEDCQTIEIEDPTTGWTFQEWADPECPKRVKYQVALNSYLEKSSYHLLYEFASIQDAQKYNPVSVKRVLHKASTTTLHDITKLPPENLRLWMRNGVMRTNAQKGISPLQPEQSIAALRDNAGAGIAIAPAVLVAIIGAVVAALQAVTVMVVELKKTSNNPYAFQNVPGLGTGPFGPEGEDWSLPPGTVPPGTTTETESPGLSDLAIPLAIGAGALLLLK